MRQAFLLPEFRIKNEFDSPGIPYETPFLWIKSISVFNTSITEDQMPLKIDFSPQLTTCLLYTSDAADERSSVDLGGRRIINKKTKNKKKKEEGMTYTRSIATHYLRASSAHANRV